VQVGGNYFLNPVAGGTGPILKYQGAPVTPGEFGGTWTLISAEQTGSTYEVAWKLGSSDQYSVWTTDSNGNYTGNSYLPGPGSSPALEALETSFHQDLNGDGTIGVVATLIQTDTNSFGSTSLVASGGGYFLDNAGTAIGPQLKYNGAPVTTGEFTSGTSTWTPIGAALTATGYEIAWKLGTGSQYSVWATDSNGNYTGNLYLPGPGNSPTLEALETSFNQDLNGDGTIGLQATVIQIDVNSFGSTSLVVDGSGYFLENTSTGIGPQLKYSGAPVTVGEFAAGTSSWMPIGAALTASGYEVAWKLGSNEYSVWTTDSNGNYTGNSYLPGPGNNPVLESIETSFHQDLNGDGVIGLPAGTSLIQTDTNSFGSTSLYQVGSNYFLLGATTGPGPELQFSGAPVTAGQFVVDGSAWAPIGAALTASGYEIAWKLGSTNQFSVWSTDSNGNYTGNLYMPGSGNAAALETLESSFHQDLNGDGTIGIPSGVHPASAAISQQPAVVAVNHDTFIFAQGSGANGAANGGNPTIREAGVFLQNVFSDHSAFFHDASRPTQGAFMWGASDGHETLGAGNHDTTTQPGLHIADLHAGYILVH
jgi:serralysin